MFHHGPRHVIQIPKDKMLLQNLQNKAPVFGAYLGAKHPDACHSEASTNTSPRSIALHRLIGRRRFLENTTCLWGLESNLECSKKKHGTSLKMDGSGHFQPFPM